jgi:hypothetical protein
MELDGFNVDLKLAFEHQGEQHYRPVSHFNRREETLIRRQRDDKMKRRLCEQQGISLIDVPFDVPSVKLSDWIRNAIHTVRPDVELADSVASVEYVASDELHQLRDLAHKRGGDCLSPVYLGVMEKHRFRCADGHEWEALASSVKQRTWCPVCKLKTLSDKRRKHSVEWMQELAQSRGGQFLSASFNSVNEKYLWCCASGHKWSANPSDVLRGAWCRTCSVEAQRGSLEEAQEIGRIRGGKCLSTEYVSTYSKLRWRCAEGHEWEARMGNVKNRGSWCPVCARRRPIRQRSP